MWQLTQTSLKNEQKNISTGFNISYHCIGATVHTEMEVKYDTGLCIGVGYHSSAQELSSLHHEYLHITVGWPGQKMMTGRNSTKQTVGMKEYSGLGALLWHRIQ